MRAGVSTLAVVGLVVLSYACTVRTTAGWLTYTSPQAVIVHEPPPPVRSEAQSPPAFDKSVWIAGHWEWRVGRYIWVPGRWERAREGYAWVAPRYVRDRGGWTYVRGHWRPARALPPH